MNKLDISYPPFEINNKIYYLKQKLGSSGYFAGAFLAATDDSLSDCVVIKLLLPRWVVTHPAKEIQNEQTKDPRSGFAKEAIILAKLEENSIYSVPRLIGISPACVDLVLGMDSKSQLKDLLQKYPAKPYRNPPGFFLDTFEGDDEKSLAALRSDLEQLGNWLVESPSGIPYLAIEFINDNYKNLEILIEPDLPFSTCLAISRNFVQVLKDIHASGIAYLDLKENHIFWDSVNQRMKIIDWNASESQATLQRQREDLYYWGAVMYRLFTGLKYTLPAKGVKGSRVDVISLASLLVGNGATTSIDFGVNQARIPFAIKAILEKLLWQSQELQYAGCDSLLNDLNHPALDEWCSAIEVSAVFLAQIGRTAEGKLAAGEPTLGTGDYTDAMDYFKDSAFFATSHYTIGLMLESRFKREGDRATGDILEEANVSLSTGNYQRAIEQLRASAQRELRSLEFQIAALTKILSQASYEAKKGDFEVAKEDYLRVLLLDYRCDAAKKGLEEIGEVLDLIANTKKALHENNYEQASILLGQLRDEYGEVQSVQELDRKTQFERHYRRAHANMESDRFASAAQELENAVKYEKNSDVDGLLKRVKEAVSILTDLDCAFEDAKYDLAGELVEKLRSLFPNSSIVQSSFERVKLEGKDYDRAYKLFKEGNASKDSDLDSAVEKLGAAWDAISSPSLPDSQEVKKLREKIKKDYDLARADRKAKNQTRQEQQIYDHAVAFLKKGHHLAETGDWDQATSVLREALQSLEHKSLDKSQAILELRGRLKSEIDTIGDCKQHEQSADKSWQNGEYEVALGLVNEVLRQYPQSQIACLLKDQISNRIVEIEELRQVISDFHHAYEKDGDLEAALGLMSRLEVEYQESWAGQYLQKEIKNEYGRNVKSVNKMLSDGESALKKKELDDAIRFFENAVNLWPNCRKARLLLETAKGEKNNLDAWGILIKEVNDFRNVRKYKFAINKLKKYLEKHPDDTYLRDLMDSIQDEDAKTANLDVQYSECEKLKTKRDKTAFEKANSLWQFVEELLPETETWGTDAKELVQKIREFYSGFRNEEIGRHLDEARKNHVSKKFEESLKHYQTVIDLGSDLLERDLQKFHTLNDRKQDLEKAETAIQNKHYEETDEIFDRWIKKLGSDPEVEKLQEKIAGRKELEENSRHHLADRQFLQVQEDYDKFLNKHKNTLSFIECADLERVSKVCLVLDELQQELKDGRIEILNGAIPKSEELTRSLQGETGAGYQFLDYAYELQRRAKGLKQFTDELEKNFAKGDYRSVKVNIETREDKSDRLDALYTDILTKLAELYQQKVEEGRKYLLEGDYDAARRAYAEARNYANEEQMGKLDGYNEAVWRAQSDAREKNEKESEQLAGEVLNRLTIACSNWDKAFLVYLRQFKEVIVPDLDGLEKMEQDYARALELNPNNALAPKLSGLLQKVRATLTFVTEVRDLVRQKKIDQAKEKVKKCGFSFRDELLEVIEVWRKLNQSLRDQLGKIQSAWEKSKYDEVLSLTQSALKSLNPEDPGFAQIQRHERQANETLKYLQSGDTDFSKQNFKEAEQAYLLVLQVERNMLSNAKILPFKKRWNRFLGNKPGNMYVKMKLDAISKTLSQAEGQRIVAMEKLRKDHYKNARNHLDKMFRIYPTFEAGKMAQGEFIVKAGILIDQGDRLKITQPSEAIGAYTAASILVNGLDGELASRAQQGLDETHSNIPMLTQKTVLRVIGVGVGIIVISIGLFFLWKDWKHGFTRIPSPTPSVTLTQEFKITSTATLTPVLTTETPTPTETPMPTVLPIIVAGKTINPLPVFSNPGRQGTPIRTYTLGQTLIVCEYDKATDTYKVGLEGDLKCIGWVDSAGVSITSISAPIPGIPTSGLDFYSTATSSDKTGLLFSNTPILICEVGAYRYRVSQSNDCSKTDGWVRKDYIRLIFLPSSGIPTQTVTQTSTSTGTSTP